MANTKVKEELFSPGLRGPVHTQTTESDNAWCGFGTVTSGQISTSISSALIDSSCIIHIDERLPGSLGIEASSGGHLIVSAITDGTSATVSNAKGVGVGWDRPFSWFLIRTKETP